MSSYVEVWGPSGRELRTLDSDRMTVGTLDSNDLVVAADGLSRVHAVFELFGDTWCIRDLGSRNGTFVNGGRIMGERAGKDYASLRRIDPVLWACRFGR